MRKTLRLTISSNESTILGVYILDVILRILPSFTIFFLLLSLISIPAKRISEIFSAILIFYKSIFATNIVNKKLFKYKLDHF